VSEQGTRIGRQSFILAMSSEGIRDILVGGGVVLVIEGRLRAP
jgi:predicted PhzF superfamily epimerase YddE/YHI9